MSLREYIGMFLLLVFGLNASGSAAGGHIHRPTPYGTRAVVVLQENQ